MSKAHLLLAVTALSSFHVAADTCQAPDTDAPYRLVFEENFDGGGLDRGRWDTEFLWGPGVIINNENQYYVNDGQFGYEPFKVSDGVLSIEAIKAPFDRTLLYLTRSIYSANTVELLWRSPENAASYEIYRDGELQGTARGGSWLERNLRDGIDYAYEVVAKDGNGNALVTAQLTVNTADRPLPGSAPQAFSLGLTSKIYAPRVAELQWQSPNRAARYEIYRNGTLYRSLTGADYKSLYESGLVEGQDYEYRVVAFDNCDEKIIEQNTTLNTGDGTSPAASLDDRLVIRSSIYSESTADIGWNAVRGARRYDIFDNGVFVSNTDGRSLFIDDLVPGVDRKFKVVALDADGTTIDQTTRVLNTADNSFALNRQPYLSGIITSYNSFRFKYGRVEARARMPAGKGLWSAFWLLNAYYKQDQPEDPEIDIIEAIGDRLTTANHAYHYQSDPDGDGFNTDRVSVEMKAQISDFSSSFHTYRVDWEPNLIVWYVDDVETGRVEGEQVSDEQMYLIANLAVGGNYPGPADSTTVFPARFQIDYIRVFQQ
ncbi:family 16 glycosylhydrolase [Granulosicoccus antarcticus]|uniref:Endo-1,3-1,4-beta-glycanase ExsH n=1 Tax=Granulosicoccus antarcticus IMCC3135 TaxID=1192854 RepID=A0A2Z2NZ53_9GAMM|nr:family 16 glycosylhydrolase [Granulosicoccus antarcticus]ASJ76732.1 Endo-1,3-1,4-beta-glycanase ExsH [Granulosicoccus antarcticus IMCC3135]